MGIERLKEKAAPEGTAQFVEKVFFEYFLGAAHASLSVAKLWSASEVRKVSAWERALPSPLPRFFEKNRVKLLILRTFLYHFNASADSYAFAKLVFRQSETGWEPQPVRQFTLLLGSDVLVDLLDQLIGRNAVDHAGLFQRLPSRSGAAEAVHANGHEQRGGGGICVKD